MGINYDGFSVQVFQSENNQFDAKLIEVDEIRASGSSIEQALENLNEKWKKHKEQLLTQGKQIPDSNLYRKYTGHFILRISPELHRKYAIEAQIQGKALNKLIDEELTKAAKKFGEKK